MILQNRVALLHELSDRASGIGPQKSKLWVAMWKTHPVDI